MTWQEALINISNKKGSLGMLNPEDVVAEAKSKDSPLHPKFTWDNSVAGHLYRLQEARKLIVLVYSSLPQADNQGHQVFVSMKEDRYAGGGYRTLVSVLQDTEQRSKLLAQAKQELLYFREKYKMLEELAHVFEEIDKV